MNLCLNPKEVKNTAYKRGLIYAAIFRYNGSFWTRNPVEFKKNLAIRTYKYKVIGSDTRTRSVFINH